MKHHLWLVGLVIAAISVTVAFFFESPVAIIVILIGLLVGLALFWVGAFLREGQYLREIHRAFRKFARKNGFPFHSLRSTAAIPPSKIELFERGERQKWTNVCDVSVNGHNGLIASFCFYESDRLSGAWYSVEVAFFPGGGAELPEFVLDPEGVLEKVMEFFRGQDIDFSASKEDAEFSSNYLLRGDDHDAICRLFNAQKRVFFAKNPAWCIKCLDGDVAIWREGNLADQIRHSWDKSFRSAEEWLISILDGMMVVAKQILPNSDDES